MVAESQDFEEAEGGKSRKKSRCNDGSQDFEGFEATEVMYRMVEGGVKRCGKLLLVASDRAES